MSAQNMSAQKKLPCPAELWPEFSALLDEALDLTDAERPAWLASLGPEFATVVPWLRKVLSGDSQTVDTGFLSTVVVEHDMAEFAVGQRVGPYVLKQRLGTGGMGEVWLASRSDGTLNRQVALKLPHTHLLAGVLKRRFERERDILSALSHPHIAQLYDAGVADAQHPYLAMEWVDGTSIIEHCFDQRLSLDRRLDLFLQILEAVGYAHGRLIAHRDLKPSNILVTRDNQVKLLDFGIAKLLNPEAESGATQLTKVGNCMATPAYAAPEQLAGEPITVSADLYALGVLLHELLTGRRPYRDNRRASLDRTEPGRASARVEEGHAPTVGGIDTKKLRRALAGDLDAIIAKALEVDPANRYSSAEAFATDLRRSRENRPISARRISAGMLTLKFVRRHRFGVAMSALLLLTLVGSSALIAWQAVRAEREAQRATTIKDFLIGVFRASDPRIASDKPRGEITARELLDVSAQKIEKSFAQQPETQIELLGVTAEIYRELDETSRSTALYDKENKLASIALGRADVHSIDGLLGQAENAFLDGDGDRSLRLLDQARSLIHEAKLDVSPLLARWLLVRGNVLMMDATKGDDGQSFLEAAATFYEMLAPHDPAYLEALESLGTAALQRSQFSDSARYYRQAIAKTSSEDGYEANLLDAYSGLALALKRLDDYDGALKAFVHGTRIAERTYGTDSSRYRLIASDLALFRYERGQRTASFDSFSTLMSSLSTDRLAYRSATDAMEAGQVMRKFGHCLAIDGQPERSVEVLKIASGLLERSAHYLNDKASLQLDLGLAYTSAGRHDEATLALRKALSTLLDLKAPDSQLAIAHERLAEAALSNRDMNGALDEFNEVLRLAAGRSISVAILAHAGLASIALARKDIQLGLRESSIAIGTMQHIEDNFDIRIQPRIWSVRAEALLAAGDLAGAHDFAAKAQDAAAKYYAPNSASLLKAQQLLQKTSLSR